MKLILYVHILIVVLVPIAAKTNLDSYNETRIDMIQRDFRMQLGSEVILSEDETLANQILMYWKRQEIDESLRNPQYLNFTKHYFAYRNDIAKSKVYQIIRRMPKGAVLHVHSSLMLSAERLLHLTYEDHLYICYEGENINMQFSRDIPQRPCSNSWTLLSKLRNTCENLTAFDAAIKSHFTLYTQFDYQKSNDINLLWMKFEKVTHAISQLIAYRPVREKFFYEALKEFYNDNIQYIEVRSGLQSLYELNGTIHDKLFMPRLYHQVAERFKQEHPDFIGVKMIVTRHRLRRDDEIWKSINMACQVGRELPEFFAGFDLVGQEDIGRPLYELLPLLLGPKCALHYYFHGGETNWYGTATDENLFDAVLLGSKRIGHAYALIKHPSLLIAIKQKDIALEVNVVSNAVLGLVQDVRNHPLATYLALGLPVVLSSDDPGIWGADPLSHDFYIAFVGVASKHADLRLLKQLAVNSIRYSTLHETNKTRFMTSFYRKWDNFIKQLITEDIPL